MDFFSFHQKVHGKAETPGASDALVVPSAQPQKDILTISELTRRIESALRDCLPERLLVKGEVSNFRPHGQSGHFYFTLKDSQTCINCVMWNSDAQRLKFELEDGMEVLASGKVGVYGQQGKYQLYASRLEPLGQGALEVAFRQVQARLEKEGLFEAERKKEIPAYPMRIVLMTSTATAALQDMLKVLRRFPWLSVMVYHAPVQGDGSAERIAAGIAEVNRNKDSIGGVDVIILGRGGGSLEDLWEFNEEIVARAMAASRIPIVTGIGHEIDVSIADLVADYHAHTPTEAAQVITAQWRGIGEALAATSLRLHREMGGVLESAGQRLAAVRRHECFRRPMDRVNQARQVLDDRQRALRAAMDGRLRGLKDRVGELSRRAERQRPEMIIERLRLRFAEAEKRLVRGAGELLRVKRMTVAALAAHLNAVGPEQVLRRGYTITTFKKGGAVVRSAGEVKEGDRLITRFADGAVETSVQDQKQLSLWE